jgi:hypothetical protein
MNASPINGLFCLGRDTTTFLINSRSEERRSFVEGQNGESLKAERDCV